MNEIELQRVYNYKIEPRDFEKKMNKEFVNIDYGTMGGSHWNCFIIKVNKSYYDNFGRTRDKFLLYQLPKAKIYHN